MMNKYGYFRYADIAFGAKEDASYTTNKDLQEGSALAQLSAGVKPYDFASFEQGEYITSQPKLLYKNQQGLGYVTKQLSDENGVFESPINIVGVFDNYYTTTGISINSKNIILDIEIIAYRDNQEIVRGSFVADKKEQFYPISIELANKIEIIVKKIAEPLHFFGFFNIEYGTVRIFEEKDFKEANITNSFSVLGDTLEYDTLDLNIVDFEDVDFLFQKKQPIEYIFDENLKSRFYVNEGQKTSDIITDLSCYDAVFNLEDDFLGGIYNNYSAKRLIDDILNGKKINYEIDENINNIKLNGYLPITSRRKALQTVLQGSNIRCYKGDKLYFKPFNTTLEDIALDETNILDNPQKTKKQEIRSVVLKNHNYSKGTELVEAYHWYISTTQNTIITFNEPLHSLKAYEVTGVDENDNDIVSETESKNVTFVKREANYCIVSNKSSNKIVIKGLKYVDSVVNYEKKNPYIAVTGSYDDINVELTISSNPQEVCNLLYDLYSRKNSINFITFENLKIGGYYNILGENLNIKSIKHSLNGLYEVEAV
jgi:hypothetical protein